MSKVWVYCVDCNGFVLIVKELFLDCILVLEKWYYDS